MRRIFSVSTFVVLLCLLVLAPGALTQTTTAIQPSAVTPTLSVSNQCKDSVTVAQLIWFNGSTPVKISLKIPATPIPPNSTVDFVFEGTVVPSAVQISGTQAGQAFSLTVEANATAQAGCASATLNVGGQQEIPPTQPNDNVPLPTQAQGLQGMTPSQAIQTLQSRGVPVTVQGSEAQPKLNNVNDPLIVGALASGVQAIGYFVSAPGQLRASVLYDQPQAGVVLVVIGGGFCASISPSFLGLSGLNVACDRPAALAPFTTIGGAPVPGFVFLVLVIKTSLPTLPYVLSLSA